MHLSMFLELNILFLHYRVGLSLLSFLSCLRLFIVFSSSLRLENSGHGLWVAQENNLSYERSNGASKKWSSPVDPVILPASASFNECWSKRSLPPLEKKCNKSIRELNSLVLNYQIIKK